MLDVTSQNRGTLTIEESERLADAALELHKGYEKSMLIKLAARTSIRETALLNLKFNDIAYDSKNDCYLVRVLDKGNKKDEKPITKEFYNDLLKIKNEYYYSKYDDSKVFHLNKDSVCDLMRFATKKCGLEDRNITFHSLKGIAINWTLENYNDIVLAQKQGNHANINTTMVYVNKSRDVSGMAGLS